MTKMQPQPHEEKLTDEERLFLALSKSRTLMRRAAEPLLKPHNITASAYNLLRVVDNSPGCTLSEAGKRLFSQAAAVTTLAQQLQHRELITIKVHQDDARTRQLWLTPKGTKLIKKLHRSISRLPEKLGITSRQLSQLIAAINQLNHKLTNNQSS